MLVELDIYSGRPNPRWKLDASASQELKSLLSRLGVSNSKPVEPPGLGYRGFLLADNGNTYRVYRGSLITPDAVLADPSYTVERFLLTGFPDELRELRERVAAIFD